MGRESLQKLWQKYMVDIAIYGHVHNYERTCPIYQVQCFHTITQTQNHAPFMFLYLHISSSMAMVFEH